MNEAVNFFETARAFAKAVRTNYAKVLKGLSVDLFNRIILRTPVDTGRARASWDLTVGSPSEFVPRDMSGQQGSRISPGRAFVSTFAGGTHDDFYPAEADKIDADSKVFITSNLDYIEPLENGWSSQAPGGMVAISVAEVRNEIETIVKKSLEGSEFT